MTIAPNRYDSADGSTTPDEIARALEAIARAGGDVAAIARSLGYKLALAPV
jgi:hypothetical protein